MKTFLSPKITSGPVAPTGLIHHWILSYGFWYTQDAIGSWDFTGFNPTNWEFQTYGWATDRESVTLGSLILILSRWIQQASVRTIPTVSTLVFRCKGFNSRQLFYDTDNFGSAIGLYPDRLYYYPAYQQGATFVYDSALSNTTYYDYAFVRTATTVKVYVNGVFVGEHTQTMNDFDIWQIGKHTTNMDWCRIYDNELTENNLLYLYQNN